MKTQLEQFIDKIRQRAAIIDGSTTYGKHTIEILLSVVVMGQKFLEKEKESKK